MACDPKIYPLNPDEAAAICAKIQSESGIAIDPASPTGTATTHGVTLSWVIADGKITISIDKKPFFVLCSAIYNQLDSLFGV